MAETVSNEAARRIEDFINDYAHCLDDGDFEGWPDFFEDDGHYQIISRESFEADLPIGVMHCDGRGMFEDRIRALRRASIFEPHVYCHVLGRPRITIAADGYYDVRTNLHVLRTMQDGRTDTFATGKYLDRIALGTDSCRLRERKVVLDSRRIDILLVVPL